MTLVIFEIVVYSAKSKNKKKSFSFLSHLVILYLVYGFDRFNIFI